MWIILFVIQCIMTYLVIGFSISLIWSKIDCGDWKGWAKEDSSGVILCMFIWPFILCSFMIQLPFKALKYIIEKFAK